MKCIECGKEMKLVGSKSYYINEETGSSSCVNEYDCSYCGIKIFYNMSITEHGIEKLYLPDNLKPTDKQLQLVDFICDILPDLKYTRKSYYTRKHISKFISKYKDEAYETNLRQKELASKKVSKNISKIRKVKKKI